MRHFVFFLLGIFFSINVQAQPGMPFSALVFEPDAPYENVLVKKISGDDKVTGFIIYIKHNVALHKHETHSEHVYVIEGQGEMVLGADTFTIKTGDLVFIPTGIAHAVTVTSTIPMKVISIQAPMFDGSDRIMLKP